VSVLAACSSVAPESHEIALVRSFPTSEATRVTLPGCPFASPLVVGEGGATALLVADSDGLVRALDPLSGALAWSRTLPAPAGEQAFVVATPVVVGNDLIVAYHTIAAGGVLDVNTARLRHRVAAIDLTTHAIDARLPPFDFSASLAGNDGGPVDFLAGHHTSAWGRRPRGFCRRA